MVEAKGSPRRGGVPHVPATGPKSHNHNWLKDRHVCPRATTIVIQRNRMYAIPRSCYLRHFENVDRQGIPAPSLLRTSGTVKGTYSTNAKELLQ